MSSNEEDYNESEAAYKKRRVQRACDICRRKKIRCDGVKMPGNRCSNCIAYNFSCTYIEAAKKRGPPKGYVENLELRLEKLEKLLKRLCPDPNVLRELDIALDNDTLPLDQPPVDPSPLVLQHTPPSDLQPRSVVDIATSIIRDTTKVQQPHSDDLYRDDAHLILAENLSKLSLEPKEYRFFGKSSGLMLIQTAIELKNEYAGTRSHINKLPILGLKRPQFWTPKSWESIFAPSEPNTPFIFPDSDLLETLVDSYFEQINLVQPLFHRPTFERGIRDGLHYRDVGFGCVLLMVCAIGSKFSDDKRVLLDNEESQHSSGWKWFEQVTVARKSILSPPTLYDLQYYCLAIQFLQGSSAPQSCWTMVGIGIRLAQDVGVHRRGHKGSLTVEDELWKRAFWVLLYMDRHVSAALGRPCAIQDEDFDVDLPVDCDDEYWEHPDVDKRWKQPEGKPSLMAAFLCSLKLGQILGFTLRTIYSINKSKILLGFVGSQWEQTIVAELDSALNHFVDTIPDHLRWDPNRENLRFFNQSVVLWSTYYHIQILIHRPFIPSPSKPSPLSFPSLAICTNAARSCIHVVDVQFRKRGRGGKGGGIGGVSPPVHMPVFTSGIVLLLSIWGGRKSGLMTDPIKEMADVHKCMAVLSACEDKWHSAGRLWDILYELASVGDLPLPQMTMMNNKRDRDADSPKSMTSISTPGSTCSYSDIPTTPCTTGTPSTSASTSTSTAIPTVTEGPRVVAGSKRVNENSARQQQKRNSNSNTMQMVGVRSSPPLQKNMVSTSATGTIPISEKGKGKGKEKGKGKVGGMSTSTHSVGFTPIQTQDIGGCSTTTSTTTPTPISATAPTSTIQPPELYALPVYSNDLGRLPLHGEIKFSAQPQPQLHTHNHAHTNFNLHPSTSASHFWYPFDQTQIPQHQHQHSMDTSTSEGSGPSSTMSTMTTMPGNMGIGIGDNSGLNMGGMDPDSHMNMNMNVNPGMGMSMRLGGLGTGIGTNMGMGTMGSMGMGSIGMGSMGMGMGVGMNMGMGMSGMNMGMGMDMGMSSEQEADFIFNQLAMGYPAPFAADLQPTAVSSNMSSGMGGIQIHGHGHQQQQRGQIQHQQQQQDHTSSGSGSGSGSGNASGSGNGLDRGYLDSDTMAMWTGAPSGFQLDDWGAYLNSVSEITQGTFGHGHGNHDSTGGGNSGSGPGLGSDSGVGGSDTGGGNDNEVKDVVVSKPKLGVGSPD